MSEKYYLLFKWGTLKGWKVPEGECFDLLKEALEGSPISAMADRPNEARKDAMCRLIDKMVEHGATFSNDWDGKEYTAEQAKDYVMNYGKATA